MAERSLPSLAVCRQSEKIDFPDERCYTIDAPGRDAKRLAFGFLVSPKPRRFFFGEIGFPFPSPENCVMILCYMDESGTPETPNQSGVTSHFVLVGLAIPVWHWKTCDDEIASLKQKYSLENVEIHCAWMTRRYSQQNTIKNFVHNFDKLGYEARRKEIEKLQNRNRLTWPNKKQRDRIYPYIHLTVDERIDFFNESRKNVIKLGTYQAVRRMYR